MRTPLAYRAVTGIYLSLTDSNWYSRCPTTDLVGL
jgi:hypothetical protein